MSLRERLKNIRRLLLLMRYGHTRFLVYMYHTQPYTYSHTHMHTQSNKLKHMFT